MAATRIECCLVGTAGLVGSHILYTLKQNPAIATIHAYTRRNSSDDSRQAGSFAAQRKIDYDLNVALAKAAKARGVQTYVLISTSGAHPDSRIPYSKMKGELDEAVEKLGFRRTVILKPGLLVGTREDSRPGEFVARKVAGWLGSWSEGWAQRAEIVALAAVRAALEEGDGICVLDQKEIVKLGGR